MKDVKYTQPESILSMIDIEKFTCEKMLKKQYGMFLFMDVYVCFQTNTSEKTLSVIFPHKILTFDLESVLKEEKKVFSSISKEVLFLRSRLVSIT